MLNNHHYNLHHQLTQELKSLWRITNMYKKDSGDCAECVALWDKLEKDKERHVQDLEKLVHKHEPERL